MHVTCYQSALFYTQLESCQLQPVPCSGWSGKQQAVKHRDTSVTANRDTISIVVCVPLSHAGSHCRRKRRSLE